MQLVVLAAGRGTRLRPVTDDRSKAMVPVCGTPLAELAIGPWIDGGIGEIILVVAPEDEEIRAHFSGQGGLEISVRFVEQRERRGMAHALDQAAPLLDGDFALTACDSLIDAAHVVALVSEHQQGSAVLSLMEVADELVSRSAAVELDGDRVRFIVEKPGPGRVQSSTVSLPHYILPFSLLDLLADLEPSPRGELELQSAIQRFIDLGGRTSGVWTDSRLQVSSPEDLRRLNLEMLRSVPDTARRASSTIGEGTVVRMPVRVEPGVTIGRDCAIGPDVYLENGCVLGDRVEIRDAVVLRSAAVKDDCRIDGEVVC